MAVSIPSTESLRRDEFVCMRYFFPFRIRQNAMQSDTSNPKNCNQYFNVAVAATGQHNIHIKFNQMSAVRRKSNRRNSEIDFGLKWKTHFDSVCKLSSMNRRFSLRVILIFFRFIRFFFNFLSVFSFCYSLCCVCMFAFTFERSVSLTDTLIFEYRPSVFICCCCSLCCVNSCNLSLSVSLSLHSKQLRMLFMVFNNWFQTKRMITDDSKWRRSKYIKLEHNTFSFSGR